MMRQTRRISKRTGKRRGRMGCKRRCKTGRKRLHRTRHCLRKRRISRRRGGGLAWPAIAAPFNMAIDGLNSHAIHSGCEMAHFFYPSINCGNKGSCGGPGCTS